MSYPAFNSTKAVDVKPGDIVVFDDPNACILIEEVRKTSVAGWMVLSSNNRAWELYLQNTDTVRIVQ